MKQLLAKKRRYPGTDGGRDALSDKDVRLLNRVLAGVGAGGGGGTPAAAAAAATAEAAAEAAATTTKTNVTRRRFVRVPSWVDDPKRFDQHGRLRTVPPLPPCLHSVKSRADVFLLEEGWRDLSVSSSSSIFASACPLPRGGQVALAEEGAPVDLSIIVAFRNRAIEVISSLCHIILGVREGVESIEILLLDMASSRSQAIEVLNFVRFVVEHLGLRVRLFKFSVADPYVRQKKLATRRP